MPMLICHEKSLEELHSITWRDVFRKHSVFTGLLRWIWKPGDILFSPQVTEHFSDITSLQKRYALQFPMSRAELLPLFYSDFPLYSDSLIFFFTWRLLSVAKRWHILVSRVVSSSDSFHSGCIINFTVSRTDLGLLASFNRVRVGFFWYPLHVTGMWAKLSPWPHFSRTESGTPTLLPPSHIIFDRGSYQGL